MPKTIISFVFVSLIVLVVVISISRDSSEKKGEVGGEIDQRQMPVLISEVSRSGDVSMGPHGNNLTAEDDTAVVPRRATTMASENKEEDELVRRLIDIDSEIGNLFLDIEGVADFASLDAPELRELNDRISQFFVDHDIIRLINEGRIEGVDREAVSKLFEHTTRVRKSISDKGIARLEHDIEKLRQDIATGELPMPQPLTLAQRQAVEDRVRAQHEAKRKEVKQRRQQEDEAFEAELTALN